MSTDNEFESRGYEVGYRKPPKHSRFRPGQSGNLAGRPRGVLNVATVLLRACREKVVIVENGRRKTVTKLEASVKQLVNKAAQGDLSALSKLLALMSTELTPEKPPTEAFDEVDQKVLLDILKRQEKYAKERGSDES